MILTGRLPVATSEPTQFLDITRALQDEVTRSGLTQGRVHVQSLHTTLGVTINENEPLLLADMAAMLERLVPRAGVYLHDDFSRRTGIAEDEPANGHSHLRLLLFAPGQSVLVEHGQLVLGRWQSVFAVELDGPRDRELAVQLEGEFEGEPAGLPVDLVELELLRQLAVDPAPVAVPMRRLVEAGGKRVRPMLVRVAGQAGPRHDPLRSGVLAAAIELIHSATLVHDDYVDESPHRRGRATVAAFEGAGRAIAVGDYYFAKATRVIAELGDGAVTSTVAEAMEAICQSQIDDVALRGQFPGDRESYLKVVRGKTAALMAAACVAGAQLSGSAPPVVERLRRYGELVGTAFQMADDLVDFSPTSGKPESQDIRQRTVSLPLIYATEDAAVGPELRRLLDGPLDDGEVAEATALVRRSGALERVGREARELVAEAVDELAAPDLEPLRPVLVALANSAVDRAR